VDLDTLEGLFECECHTTTDDESVDFSDEIVDQLDLIGDLGSTEDSQERTFRFLKRFGKVLKFLLHKESRSTLRQVNSNHRRVSTVSSSKRIIYQLTNLKRCNTDINVCERSERFSEFRDFCRIRFSFLAFFIFGASLFLNMETQILKENNLA
jgi:hypothetical protein